MFCPKCGKTIPEGTAFCPGCGNRLAAQAQPAAPQQPVAPQQPAAPQPAAPQQPVAPQPQSEVVTIDFAKLKDQCKNVTKYLHLIIAGFAVVAFLFGILNVFSAFHVNGIATYSGDKETNYISVSEAAEMMEWANSFIAPVYIGNIIFGIACLAAAAIGILYFLKMNNNMPYYDQYIGKVVKLRPALMMGALVVAGAIVQNLAYLLCTAKGWGITIMLGVNWTTWLLLVLFAAFAVVDKFVLEEKKPAETYTPVQ